MIILAYQNRVTEKIIVINDVNGNPITPGPNDLVRVVVGYERAAPIFQVTSGANAPGGSMVTNNFPQNGQNLLKLVSADMTFAPGVYSLSIDYFDNADNRAWKTVARGVFCMRATPNV